MLGRCAGRPRRRISAPDAYRCWSESRSSRGSPVLGRAAHIGHAERHLFTEVSVTSVSRRTRLNVAQAHYAEALMTVRPQEWFEMNDVRRRALARAVWIPLRAIRTVKGEDGSEEVFAAGGTAFPPVGRGQAEQLGWDNLGLGHEAKPFAFDDGTYKPVEVYQHDDKVDLGIDLIFTQHVGAGHPSIWHVSQDLVMALGLIKEGDIWVRPEEGYVEVIREERNRDGEVKSIEIKAEFLRDYLAARGLAFRSAIYRERSQVVRDASHIGWPEAGLRDAAAHRRFKAEVYEVEEQGWRTGRTLVLHTERTDVDPDEDVPVFGPETHENVRMTTTEWDSAGPTFFRIVSDFWSEEWVEPADHSVRVRGDADPEVLTFVVNASGSRAPTTALNSEDIRMWLWFFPSVIPALMGKRGGGLAWYTAETGGVWCLPGWDTHFGVDRSGLVNVYAYDVARAPLWQQRIWAGHNVTPSGPVSTELLDAQMRGYPASTKAPETKLVQAFAALDEATTAWLGKPAFAEHHATSVILEQIHRFRGLDAAGVLALAKDLARLVADRVDIAVLRKAASPSKGENWGTLKSLEKAAATLVSAENARALLTPLVGTYDLRLGDAHLPSSKVDEAFALVGIDRALPTLQQAVILIDRNAEALSRIAATFADAALHQSG